jgi:hypothetical protein
MPFLFYKYGATIRSKCKFAAEAEAFMTRLRNEAQDSDPGHDSEPEEAEYEKEQEALETPSHPGPRYEGIKASPAASALRPTVSRTNTLRATASRSSARSGNRGRVDWDDNPYAIDRVNTRESFRSGRSRSRTGPADGLGR